MIVDVHSHLAHPSVLPTSFFDGWADNLRRLAPPGLSERALERLAQRFGAPPPDLDGDAHVAAMDAAGIGCSVLLVIDFGRSLEEVDLEALFDAHQAVAERHPGRFRVFAGVDPRRGEAGVASFERALRERGFSGLKLYPPCGFSPSDPALDPYYALCAEHEVPVLTHLGPTSPRLSFRHTRPEDVDEAAFRFPGVDFVLAHGAVVHQEEAALLAEYRPNVYLDTAGFQVAARRGDWAPALQRLKRTGLLRKLLFGTDWPVHWPYGSLRDVLGRLSHEVLGAAELRWVLEDNPRDVLRLP